MATKTDTYAIISLGGKQYRVHEGERLVVDRIKTDEGKTFHPNILFLGGDGKGELGPKTATVTARVLGHVLGEKVRIGKSRAKTGYRQHTGFRARLTEIQIEAIGKKSATRATATEEKPAVAEKPKAAAKPKTTAPKKTATAKKPAKKPAAKKTEKK